MALSQKEQVAYILDPELRKRIREISYLIEEKTRQEWNNKYFGLNTTNIYRKLAREILKVKGPMDIRDLFRAIMETGRISGDTILPFFISNLMMDPEPETPLVIYHKGNKVYIALG